MERKWWSRALLLSSVLGCAKLVGFRDEYFEIDPNLGGRAGSGGQAGSAGSPSGTGGEAGSGAGSLPEAGDAGAPPQSGGSGGGGSGSGGAAGGTAGGASGAGEGGDAGAGSTGGGGAGGESGAGSGGGGSAGSSGGGPTFPSCEGLPRTCGPDGNSDCCESIAMSGGTYDRKNDAAYPATVSAFSLDRYEVTVGRFRRFVAEYPDSLPADGAGKNPSNPEDPGWEGDIWNELIPRNASELQLQLSCEQFAYIYTWTNAPGENETRPINCVTWPVAFAFCIWDGGRLPTEAELNFAEAGGSEQRIYPWSNPAGNDFITPEHASYQLPVSQGETGACWGDGQLGCAVTDFVPVGSKPAGMGLFGHFELAGNVWEWARDTSGEYAPDCDDCANFTPAPTLDRILRGGGYFSIAQLLRNDFRFAQASNAPSTAVGVRCARPVSEQAP